MPNGGIPLRVYLRPTSNPGWVLRRLGGELRVVTFLRAWLGDPRDDPTRLAEGLHVSFKLFEPYDPWPG
jgi:hypothetical protein